MMTVRSTRLSVATENAIAFPTLTTTQIAALRFRGQVRAVRIGAALFADVSVVGSPGFVLL